MISQLPQFPRHQNKKEGKKRKRRKHTLPKRQSNPELLRLDILKPAPFRLRIALQNLIARRMSPMVIRLVLRAHIGSCAAHVVALIGHDNAAGGVRLDRVHGDDVDFSRKLYAIRLVGERRGIKCPTRTLDLDVVVVDLRKR